MSLDDVTAPADEEFELCQDLCGDLEYPVRTAKFNGVCAQTHMYTLCAGISHLCMHVPRSVGGESIRIVYIGLRGEHSPLSLQG